MLEVFNPLHEAWTHKIKDKTDRRALYERRPNEMTKVPVPHHAGRNPPRSRLQHLEQIEWFDAPRRFEARVPGETAAGDRILLIHEVEAVAIGVINYQSAPPRRCVLAAHGDSPLKVDNSPWTWFSLSHDKERGSFVPAVDQQGNKLLAMPDPKAR